MAGAHGSPGGGGGGGAGADVDMTADSGPELRLSQELAPQHDAPVSVKLFFATICASWWTWTLFLAATLV